MPDLILESSLRQLFDHGRDAMFIADLEGNFSHVNKAFLKLYCFTEDDVIGQPIGMIKSHLHDEELYQSIQSALDTTGSWSGELRNSSYAGEIIHIWTQIIKTEDSYVGLQVDLRERDRTSRQVEQTARLESISTLAGGIAHEFNNILAGIQGHLYMVRKALPKSNEKENDRMKRIGGLIERASTLVQNMLVFSKQKQTINRTLSLATLLKETIDLAKPLISSSVEVSLDVKQRNLLILADAIQLKQSLFELLSNANNAFNTLDPSKRVKQIKVTLTVKESKHAEISISDNGCGMSEVVQQHCLDPFYTTQAVGQGTGLGLSSANSYVKQLHGSLNIKSMKGRGTTVKILLPLESETKTIKPLGKTVLLVDDDEAVRISMHEILISLGYDVLEAVDGIQALDLWQQNEAVIDAVIMDIVMPNMDGLEVARKIRNSGSLVPICMMTGYSNQTIQPDLHVHLLRKPVDPDLILTYLSHQLDSSSEN